MYQLNLDRRTLFVGSAAAALVPLARPVAAHAASPERPPTTIGTTVTLTQAIPPAWLVDMWKEIDDKTFGRGFDCFAENAVCNLGVADWQGREAIRANLRAFIDKGMTTHHDVVEYWDAGLFKVFHGIVTMKFDDPAIQTVRPTMTHFFYMDQADSTKVIRWKGAVGPTAF